MVYYLGCIHHPVLQRTGGWENAGISSCPWVKQEGTLSSSPTEEVLDAMGDPQKSLAEQSGAQISLVALPQKPCHKAEWQVTNRGNGGKAHGFEIEALYIVGKFSTVPLEGRTQTKRGKLFLDSFGNRFGGRILARWRGTRTGWLGCIILLTYTSCVIFIMLTQPLSLNFLIYEIK